MVRLVRGQKDVIAVRGDLDRADGGYGRVYRDSRRKRGDPIVVTADLEGQWPAQQ